MRKDLDLYENSSGILFDMIRFRHISLYMVFFCIFVPFDFIDAQKSALLSEFSKKSDYLEVIENNYVEVLDECTFFDSLIESISKAEKYVLMESFIFSDDTLATRILDILVEKVSEGVRSYLIFDYLGCLSNMGNERRQYLEKGFKPGYIEGYREKGLNIVFYNSTSFMPRNHRKLVIVDGKQAFTGGINVTEQEGMYMIGVYHDKQVKIEGPAVKAFHLGFYRMWNSCGDCRLDIRIPEVPAPARDVPLVILETSGRETKPRMQDLLEKLFEMTKDSLHIICPYIWPDRKVQKDLMNAADRGVNIKILMGEICDIPKVFEGLVRYKARIWAKHKNISLFIHPASFHHEKVIISDGRLVWIGSHNLDILSLDIDHELSVLLDDPKIVEALEEYFASCAEVEEK